MKGDKESNGLIENAVMLIRGIIRTIKCHIETSTQEPLRDESPILPWLVDTHRMHPVQVSKRSRRENAIRKTARQKTVTSICPICGESVGKAKLHRSHEQNEPQMQVRDLAWNAKQQCMMFHEECRWCRAREIRILEPQSRWDKADGRWTVDRPDIRVDPIPIPPLPCKGARIQRERITKQDIDEFGVTVGCPKKGASPFRLL